MGRRSCSAGLKDASKTVRHFCCFMWWDERVPDTCRYLPLQWLHFYTRRWANHIYFLVQRPKTRIQNAGNVFRWLARSVWGAKGPMPRIHTVLPFNCRTRVARDVEGNKLVTADPNFWG
ncbi:unnamed protein product [Sphacelaria rigidula]